MVHDRYNIVIIFFSFVFVLISATSCFIPINIQQKLMPGWQIIRPPNVVSALAIQEDIIWAGGDNDVYCIDCHNGTVIKKLECNPPLEYVKALLVESSGDLYIGHFKGLTYYDGTTCQTLAKKDGLSDDIVNALLEDRDGQLWVGTWDGVAIRQGERWKTLTSVNGPIDDMVNVMLQDSKGGMWLGSYVAPAGGISYFKDDRWQLFSTKQGLPHNNITSLIEARDGTIWAGTGFSDHGGAAQFLFTDNGWIIKQTLTRRDGLAGNKVRSLIQDKDGALWFGSEYDGLARYHNGQWLVLNTKNGLPHPEVLCMAQDEDGTMWIGTIDGLLRISYEAIRALPQK